MTEVSPDSELQVSKRQEKEAQRIGARALRNVRNRNMSFKVRSGRIGLFATLPDMATYRRVEGDLNSSGLALEVDRVEKPFPGDGVGRSYIAPAYDLMTVTALDTAVPTVKRELDTYHFEKATKFYPPENS